MTARQPKLHAGLGHAAVQIFAANERINQILIEHLGPVAWTAKMPGKNRVRTIAAIFTHVHNVRCKWVRLAAPHLKIPKQLDRTHARRSRPAQGWPRARLAAWRCSRRHSMVVAAWRNF